MADGDSKDDYVASDGDGTSSVSSHNESLHAPNAQRREVRRRPRSNGRSAKGYLSKDYRDLLNIDIADVRCHVQSTDLDASQIGASKWTAREKEALFQGLASHGPDHLERLGRAVQTKSEQEIRTYLLLLQAAVSAQDSQQASLHKPSIIMQNEIPAAAEISADCERVLDLAADALAAHVEKHISQQQHAMFGDDWLVDADVAESMDASQEQSQSGTDRGAHGTTEADDSKPLDAQDHAPTIPSYDVLLRPSAFLQLSRNMFMNNGEDNDLNWHHVDPISTDSTEPVLYRSALEDLRNVVVSITRRIVQATIFQATSRLRAEDASRKDWSPLSAIREVDVRTAVDLLNLPRDSRAYWTMAARRCRVGVFSDSKKYADGRPSTKSGHLLAHDEVEIELGLQNDGQPGKPEDSKAQSGDDDDIDEMMDDSDLFTEEETVASPSEMHKGSHIGPSVKAPSKRKRALSASSFLRAETQYLEAIDEAANMREERRLWELLRRDPPASFVMDGTTAAGKIPVGPSVETSSDWRAQTGYESDWEQPDSRPTTKRFKSMDALGKAGKAARETLLKELQQRLEMIGDGSLHINHMKDDETHMISDEEDHLDAKPSTSLVDSDNEDMG